jgi:hypothetical protein
MPAKPDGVGAGFQFSILKGEQSGLLTRMATESVSSSGPKKSAFVELERAIHDFALDLIS